MGVMRHLPLALQWAYTTGACGLFASVSLQLAFCHEAEPRSFSDDEDGYHIAVALADGRYLDAEGVRDRDDIIACFGMDRATLREQAWRSEHAHGSHEAHLLELLHAYGWNESPPLRIDGASASSSPKRASSAFERVGGMSSSPVEVIGRYMKMAA